jgi:hypothetical protein
MTLYVVARNVDTAALAARRALSDVSGRVTVENVRTVSVEFVQAVNVLATTSEAGDQEVPDRIDDFEREVRVILQQKLNEVGIPSNVNSEKVRGTKLHRFFVEARRFKEMSYTERQHLVWRIVERELSPENVLRISMIMTTSPGELEGK